MILPLRTMPLIDSYNRLSMIATAAKTDFAYLIALWILLGATYTGSAVWLTRRTSHIHDWLSRAMVKTEAKTPL